MGWFERTRWSQRKKLITCFGLLALLEGLILASVLHYGGQLLHTGDAIYDAQVAREIHRTGEYKTKVQPLWAISASRSHGLSDQGELWISTHKFPLPAYVRAFFFKFFGLNEYTAFHLYSQFFHVLSLVVLFFAGVQHTGAIKGGLVPCLFFLAHPFFLFHSSDGLNLVADAFLLLCVFTLFASRQSLSKDILLGLMLGLAFLNRYSNISFSVAVALLLIADTSVPLRKRASRLLLIAVIGGLVASPVFIHSWIHFDRLFVSTTGEMMWLFGSKYLQEDPWYVLDRPSISLLSLPGAKVLLSKTLQDTPSLLRDFLLGTSEEASPLSLLLLPLAVWGFASCKHLATQWLAFFATGMVVLSPIVWSASYLKMLMAPLFLIASVGFISIEEELQLRGWPIILGRSILFGLVALSLYTSTVFIVGLGSPVGNQAERIRERWDLEDDLRNMDYVRIQTKPQDVILSNTPWNIAWYADRKSLPLPKTPVHVYLLESSYGVTNIQAVYLHKPTHAGDGILAPERASWIRLWHLGEAFEGFYVDRVFPNGALFLRRKAAAPFPGETQEVDFGTEQGNAYLAQSSWRFNEKTSGGDTFVWAQSLDRNVISLIVGHPLADVEILMTAIRNSEIPQSVYVYFNECTGEPVARLSLQAQQWTKSRFVVPREKLRLGYNQLCFVFGHTRISLDGKVTLGIDKVAVRKLL